MAQVVYSARALADLETRVLFLARDNESAALDALRVIRSAVMILEDHPLIGRAISGELRELIISFGQTGYIAVYRFIPGQNLVRILGIRHQRDLGRDL